MKNSLGRVLEASFIRAFAGLMVLMCLIFAYKYDAKAAGTAGIIEQKKEGKITWTLTSDGELTVSGKIKGIKGKRKKVIVKAIKKQTNAKVK